MRLTRLIPVFPAAILKLTALPDTLHAQGADTPTPCGQTGNTREDDANRYTTRSTMFGIGGTNRLETYLSPLEYTGPEVRFMRESIRMTRMWGGRVSTQQFYEGNFSYSKNPTKDSEYLSGDIDWRIGWHYNWTPLPALRLMAGLQTGLSCGFVYNTSNGNNPAQGKLSTNIAASGMAIYRFNWLRRRFSVRYQFDLPLAALMFSPNYGQTYNEKFTHDIYDNAKSVSYIYGPKEHAFREYDRIFAEARQLPKDRLIIIVLGPTAKLLAYDLNKLGYRALDLGHMAKAYEWLKTRDNIVAGQFFAA